jgi:hypothetical protein
MPISMASSTVKFQYAAGGERFVTQNIHPRIIQEAITQPRTLESAICALALSIKTHGSLMKKLKSEFSASRRKNEWRRCGSAKSNFETPGVAILASFPLQKRVD